tara:strand:- start:367 stop:1044 length:678 start_codon:yes stop_codon:yes gene_type:complete
MIAMMDISKWHRFEDDFYRLTVDADFWTLTEDAGKTGTDVINDEDGGWFKNFCDGDDNDESYRISHGQSWKFQTDKLLYLETSIQLTEAATDDANWIVGLSDSAGANMLLDDGAGPAASYDGAVFFKVDGTLQVQFETSNAGTQVTTATGLTAFVSGTTYKLAFLYDYKDGTTASVTPFIDGVAGTAHSLTISGLEEMNLFFGVKAGGANEEAIEIDYIRVFAER